MKLTAKIQKAINFAAEKHLGQKRKGIELPYIVHPYSVAMILSDYTDDEEVIVAGLLHDVLEDVKNYSKADMARDFGERVTQIVQEVSEDRDPNVPADAKATWIQRKDKYLINLKNDSQEALLVCAADKIHNLHSIIDAYAIMGEKLWDSFNAPKEEKIQYYGKILDVLKTRLKSDIVKELEDTYIEAKAAI
ncbi:MAG: HD domain-containing protein [bacterium]